MNPMAKEARDVYRDVFTDNVKKKYLQKFEYGKNKIDQLLEVYLLDEISEKLISKDIKILELGVFAGRVNQLLRKYSNDITVTEVNSEMLKSYDQSFVLDLASYDNDLGNIKNSFDICVSLGHQVSFSCEIENSFNIVGQLLKPNGIFCLDIWNKGCNERFDPDYKISKSNYADTTQIAQKYGFQLVSFYYGQKVFYLAPRVWIVLERAFGEIFYKLIFGLEKILRQSRLRYPTQTLHFVFQKQE